MKKWYRFMRTAIPHYGAYHKFAFEEMIYPHMEFESDNDANKYAKDVLGNCCFALPLTENELKEKKELEMKFNRKFC